MNIKHYDTEGGPRLDIETEGMTIQGSSRVKAFDPPDLNHVIVTMRLHYVYPMVLHYGEARTGAELDDLTRARVKDTVTKLADHLAATAEDLRSMSDDDLVEVVRWMVEGRRKLLVDGPVETG